MNSRQNMKLSISIYKYMNQDKAIDRIRSYKKEDKVDMDDNFKQDLKQHFKALALMQNNNSECNVQ